MHKLMISNSTNMMSYFNLSDLERLNTVSVSPIIDGNIVKCYVTNHKYNHMCLKVSRLQNFKQSKKYKIKINILKNTIVGNEGETQQIPYFYIDCGIKSKGIFNKCYITYPTSFSNQCFRLSTLGLIGEITEIVDTKSDFSVCTEVWFDISVSTYLSKTGGEFWFTIDFEEVN